jgi:hypothetical protein
LNSFIDVSNAKVGFEGSEVLKMSGFSSIFGGGARQMRCEGFHSFSAYAKTEGSSLKGTVILPISCAGGQLQSEMKLWGLLHHETINSTYLPLSMLQKGGIQHSLGGAFPISSRLD